MEQIICGILLTNVKKNVYEHCEEDKKIQEEQFKEKHVKIFFIPYYKAASQYIR